MAGAIFGRGACRRVPEAVYASATDLTNRGRHGDFAAEIERKITKVSIAPPLGPARGSQPGAQAGRHALEIRKWDVRNVKIGPVIRDRSDEASRGNASGGERHVAFRAAKDHSTFAPKHAGYSPSFRPKWSPARRVRQTLSVLGAHTDN